MTTGLGNSSSELIVFAIVVTVATAAALFFVLRKARRRTGPEHETLSPSFLRGISPPQLICIAGDLQGRCFPLNATQVTIGRQPENSIVVDGDLVSRQHALIEWHSNQFTLYDCNSTNGTYVNGQQVAQKVLAPGEQIQIGPAVFVFTPAGYTGVIPSQPIPVGVAARLAGTQVYDFGEYVRTGVLGEGGAAIVYQGYARRNQQQIVAIKVLTSQDPYFRDKFQRELELGKTLSHPHITQIFGGACRDGIWYLVMEYNDAGSLRDRLGGGKLLGLDETVRIIGQTCDALYYAHRRGIYHRDVKPENIMFSHTGDVKLGDFGIARIASRRTITQQGVFIGTVPYMSFEQAKGRQDIDGRSDLYSLGIVLYEIVAGQLPFSGEPLAILEQHLRYFPPPPTHLNPSVPSWVDDVVMRALDKDRDRRFQTAEEMARALGYQKPMHDGGGLVVQQASISAPPIMPQRVQARLVIFIGGQPRGQIQLTGQTVELGRESGLFAYEDPTMSRHHARVYWNRYNWVIQDLDSANGTFLNGQRIWQPEVLLPGAMITLGDTQLRFEV